MKNFVWLILVFFSNYICAQDTKSLVVRSTTTSVTNFNSYDSNHILQQSIGQNSLIGDYSTGNYLISQGFVQTSVWERIINDNYKLNLHAKVFPNPFIDELNIHFLEDINSNLEISVFSEQGDIIKTYSQSPNKSVKLNLNYLSAGKFYLNILSGDKQFVSRLIKLK
tara:strand:- start:247 stop:747 length:501 start_codon:yes stop_codon:yes gene_type:complete